MHVVTACMQSYQTLLSLFMLLLVAFGWSPRKFEERIELRMHVVIFLGAIVYIIPPLIYEGYNPECGHCVPVPLPLNCGNWLYGDGSDCKRGSPALAFVYWIVFFTLLPTVTVFCSGAMYKVYRTVRDQEERRSSIRSFRDDHHRESKRIRRTMVLYTGSFYLCWIVPIFLLWTPHNVAALQIIGDILMPLQGVSANDPVISSECGFHTYIYLTPPLLVSSSPCSFSSSQNASSINTLIPELACWRHTSVSSSSLTKSRPRFVD